MPAIYLIRHQEPAVRGCFLGRTDPPLSDTGRVAASALQELHVRSLFVSPLRRAQETAEAIRCGARAVLLELAEIGFGEWEGLTWEEIEQRWPDLARRKADDWLGVTPPGGETWQDFCARVDRALRQIRSSPHPVAVVAHQVVNAVLAARLAGTDPRNFQQDYGEVIVCEDALEYSPL
jgi:broad specificity phosphatase PhoE